MHVLGSEELYAIGRFFAIGRERRGRTGSHRPDLYGHISTLVLSQNDAGFCLNSELGNQAA